MIVRIRPILDAATAWIQPLDFGPVDRAYVEGLIHAGRADEARTARFALLDALHQRFERHDLQWILERGEWGAPQLRLADAPSYLAPASSAAGRTPVAPFVSLAHSELAAAAAIGDRRCGVDLEPLARHRIQGAWKRVASPQEEDWALSLSPSQRVRYQLTAWTLKESWAKLSGDGLARRGRELQLEPAKTGWRVHAPIALSAFTSEFGAHILSLLVEGGFESKGIRGTETAWVQLPVQVHGS